ncbi:MAG: iron-siderophore ABC transporter substrate-binding protein [Acidimicrobiales bacterium]
MTRDHGHTTGTAGHGVVHLVVVALLGLAACGSSGDDGTAVDEPASAEAATSQGAFPVTVEHKFGTTTVESEPQRIVAVGLTEQDALLALGVVPVATTEWFGEHPGAIWPWAEDELRALEAEAPESVGDSTALNVEAVAAQRPDLILAVYSGITEEDYDQLSGIAPTVAQPAAHVDYGVPWDELTLTVGQVVGRTDEAEELVEDIEASFAAARDAHPEFDGATSVVATPYEGIYVYGPEDPRSRLLAALGFELPTGLAEVSGDEFGGNLSPERADLLDVDAIVWLDAEDVEDDDRPGWVALYETFDVHTEGREVFLDSFDDTLGGATSFISALSLPYLLEGLVPKLAAAIDGDPTTDAP